MDALSPVALVRLWYDELWNKGNVQIVEALASDDFVWHPPQDFTIALNRDQYIGSVQWYQQCFSDATWDLHDVIDGGDRVVVRCTGTATYRGGWLDIPGHGQSTREASIVIFRVADGKIAELWFEVSDLDVVQQLGAAIVHQAPPEMSSAS